MKNIDEYMSKIWDSIDNTFTPVGDKLKVGVDLGTAYIVIVVLDEDDNPVATQMQKADVLRDGVVVDYTGALNIVKQLKLKLEERIGKELIDCAIAMPAGTDSSIKTHTYVAQGAGFNVINVLDEPTCANAIYGIENGVIVDIGGGTTGLAIIENGKVIKTADEPTGGTHVSLVLAGNYKISVEDAEKLKTDYSKHKEILPVVKAVIEKMTSIVNKYVSNTDVLYLCGGTCCLTGIEEIFEKETHCKVYKPENPFLVTPAGIAINCK